MVTVTGEEGAMPIVDWEATHRNIPGGAEGFRTAVGLLLEQCAEDLEAVRAGLAAGDRKAVGLTAHRLKGAGLHFGASRFMAAAARVEASADAGDLEGARERLPALEAELVRLTSALAKGNGRPAGGNG